LPGLATPRIPAPAARSWLRVRFRWPLLPRRRTRAAPHTRFADPDAPVVAATAPAVVRDPPAPPPLPGAPHLGPALRPPAVTAPPAASAPAPETGRSDALAGLSVHLLGPLCAAVDDVPVGDWPSARCRSLFGYLLTHREPWPPREVLMGVFWPESSPEASRNSLNVAIHGLRRTLRTVTNLPVVQHGGGAYGIHPDLRLWLDVEEFESRVENGRRRQEAGDTHPAPPAHQSPAAPYPA